MGSMDMFKGKVPIAATNLVASRLIQAKSALFFEIEYKVGGIGIETIKEAAQEFYFFIGLHMSE